MATLTPEQMKSWGTNLACDLFESSGFKSRVLSFLDALDEFLDHYPMDIRVSDLQKLIRIARETVPQLGVEGGVGGEKDEK